MKCKDKEIVNIMDLSMVKCLWVQHETKDRGIKFQKNAQEFLVFTSSLPIFFQWKETLRRLVLITDFHEEYKVLKKLGKGSSAIVYKAKRKETGEEFAVKAFSKSEIFKETNCLVRFF